MKRNLFLLGIWMFTMLLWVGKMDARAENISDFEKEIEEHGFRQSTEGMTVEEVEDYLIVAGSFLANETVERDGNPYLPIRNELKCLYMGDDCVCSLKMTEAKGDSYIGIVESFGYGDTIFPKTGERGYTTFEFVVKNNWEIQIMDDTVISSESGYFLTFPKQNTYRLNGYMIQEYESAWQDRESGMKFEITFPFLTETGEGTWNQWEAVNRAIRDTAASWILSMDKTAEEHLYLDYQIKTLDDELYSVLYTGTAGEHIYRFGVTVSLGTGERLPISAVMEELPEDDSQSEDYDYYVTDDIIYVLGINGSISGARRLDYQPYIWEEKIEEIYDDTGVLTGTISFQYPVLQENRSHTGIINQKIMEDVEFFYAEVLERFTEKALLNAEQMRELYHQEGQEGYEYAMSMWKDMGGYTSLQITCNMIRNNDGQFGVSYQLGDWCYAYICDLKTAKVLEGEDAVERMAEYWNAQEVLQ